MKKSGVLGKINRAVAEKIGKLAHASTMDKRTVSFVDNATPVKDADPESPSKIIEIGESRDDMLRKVKDLKRQAQLVEKRVPLVAFKNEDEMQQLKFFILKYYQPILSVYEENTLKNITSMNYQEEFTEVKKYY